MLIYWKAYDTQPQTIDEIGPIENVAQGVAAPDQFSGFTGDSDGTAPSIVNNDASGQSLSTDDFLKNLLPFAPQIIEFFSNPDNLAGISDPSAAPGGQDLSIAAGVDIGNNGVPPPPVEDVAPPPANELSPEDFPAPPAPDAGAAAAEQVQVQPQPEPQPEPPAPDAGAIAAEQVQPQPAPPAPDAGAIAAEQVQPQPEPQPPPPPPPPPQEQEDDSDDDSDDDNDGPSTGDVIAGIAGVAADAFLEEGSGSAVSSILGSIF